VFLLFITKKKGFPDLSKASKEITPDKFAGFLAWLAPDAETAGVEYERLQFRLINYFLNRNCRFAEELADETINRVMLKIGEQTIENKSAFVYGFAKNIYLESLRKEKTHLNIDEINIAGKPPEEKENSFSNECLEKCLNELSTENRCLILEYFSEDKQAKIDLHKRLSETLQTTQTALRMKIVRIKQKLKLCLEDCMAV
jgi:DNA-directed RNA polymerase specialized sigma24 family protein